jgi:vacuolar-type H+-ATPase subunit C/Vma6
MLLSNVQALLKKIFAGEDDRHIMFLISPISSYFYDLMKTLYSARVLMQLVSEYQALAP